MKYRALGTFGLSLTLAFTSSYAWAQDDEEGDDDQEQPAKSAEKKPEEKPEAKPADKAEASVSLSATSSGDPKAEASAKTSDASPATAQGDEDGQAPPPRPPVYGQREDWVIQPYGYARFDAISDSTQSFEDGLQPYLIQRVGTYRGDHRRSIFTARDSRLGFYVAAPNFHGIKTSGQIELDFYGLQVTDAKKHDQVVFGPLRIRHAFVKIETSVLDIVAGQYYDVFGWGSTFYPATGGYLGVPGEIYHRNPQLRLEKKLHAGDLEVHIAAAAVRPGQRDSGGIPDGEAGIKLAYDGWKGVATPGFGRAGLVPAALGVSGLFRHYEVPAFEPDPGSEAKTINGWGVSAHALLPVIPASTLDNKGNSLTATGEFSIGTGIADMYSGMDGGSRLPLLPNPSMAAPAYVYPQNIDPGLVTFDRNFAVKTINWKAFVAGLQYYLPVGNGRIWLSGIYSRVWSDNIKTITPPTNWGGVFTKMEYIDASLGFDITPAVAMGLSFQTVKQTFGDVSPPTPEFGSGAEDKGPDGFLGIKGTGNVAATARNNRGQLSVAFFF